MSNLCLPTTGEREESAAARELMLGEREAEVAAREGFLADQASITSPSFTHTAMACAEL
jgi:hypothetical protein